MPLVNRIGNLITGYDRSSDPDIQRSRRAYPGSGACNRRISHAKWHEIAANAFVDFIFLVDDGYRVLKGGNLNNKVYELGDTWQCIEKNDCMEGFVTLESNFRDKTSSQIVEVFRECFLSISESNALSFEACMLNSLLASDSTRKSKWDTIDSCLVANECLNIPQGSDISRILRPCIKANGVCGSYLNADERKSIEICMSECDGGYLCTVGCFQRVGILLSPYLDMTSSCLNTLLADPQNERDYEVFRSMCEQFALDDEQPSRFATTQTTFTIGFPKFVTCVTTSCGESYRDSPFYRALMCVAKCSSDDKVKCILECFLNQLDK